jgi:hypothetical protein
VPEQNGNQGRLAPREVVMRTRTALVVSVLLGGSLSGAAGAQGLKGDPEAIVMARRMMDQMGERAAWVNATSMHVVEESYPPDSATPLRSESWKMLREPSLWWVTQGAEGSRSFAYTRTQGWRLRDGRLTTVGDLDLRQWRGRWARNVYVMYHRLANEDPRLWLHKERDRRFLVLDADTGDRLCSFEVAAGGEIVRWASSYGPSTEEWIYGPLASFGNIRMPAWGARVHDGYRFFYRSVSLSKDSPPISFDPPAGAAARGEP